ARFGDDDARRIADERPPPELDLLVARFLDSDAVHRDDEHAVGDRVALLDGLPRSELRGAELRLVARQPTYRRRVTEHLRTAKRGEARGLGVPLVPAKERADDRRGRRTRDEPEIARREVELLVVLRVVRDVHLPVERELPPVRAEDDDAVVV